MTNAPAPPQNLEAEESVLGAMMISERAIDRVSEVIVAADFYRESHGWIFQALVDLHAESQVADAITVAPELDRRGQLAQVGGKKRIHELAALVPATANAPHYARSIRDLSLCRELILYGQNVTRLGWEHTEAATALIERVQEEAFALSGPGNSNELPSISEFAREAYDQLIAMYESGRELTGIATGYKQLDAKTSGLQRGNLVVVAARPSMGKSALAMGFIAHAVFSLEVPTALFTIEMSTSEAVHRLIAHEGLVDLHKLRSGRLDGDQWSKVGFAVGKIEGAPLYIDDSGAPTMTELRARARRWRLQHAGDAMVVVDYLQLMSAGESESRVQDVSKISRGLKLLARELDLPVVAVSQLSRAPEQRHDKRPMLSDLRESGSIEQDADVVMFVYRDEYYNPEDAEVAGQAEVNIAKQRNGPTGMTKLTFVKRYARFSDPAQLPGGSVAVA